MINRDQVLSGVRWLLTTLGSYAAGAGYLTADQATMIVGIGVSLVPLVWSFVVHGDA